MKFSRFLFFTRKNTPLTLHTDPIVKRNTEDNFQF